jgi:hypothetical protein
VGFREVAQQLAVFRINQGMYQYAGFPYRCFNSLDYVVPAPQPVHPVQLYIDVLELGLRRPHNPFYSFTRRIGKKIYVITHDLPQSTDNVKASQTIQFPSGNRLMNIPSFLPPVN